jgi:hypothetical protein
MTLYRYRYCYRFWWIAALILAGSGLTIFYLILDRS